MGANAYSENSAREYVIGPLRPRPRAGTGGRPKYEGLLFRGQYKPSRSTGSPGLPTAMTTPRRTTAPATALTPPAASAAATVPGPKLRQTQAEYTAARPNAEPGVKPMMSSSKMYVCIRCHANFKTGDGKPDPRLRGLGRCNNCLGVTVPTP